MKSATPAANWLDNNDLPRTLTQSIALEESPVPGILQTGVTLIAIFLGIFILWASIAPVEEVASATGEIVPSGYVQEVQHLDGGIVRDIMVEEGQLVEKGQVLFRLDDTNATADLGQMKARQKTLQLQADRLRSFSNGNNTSTIEALTKGEMDILRSMEESRRTQQNVLNDQIAQKEKELDAIRSSAAMLQKNVILMRQEHDTNRLLAQRGSGSKIQAMTSERELNALQGQLRETKSQELRALNAISEFRNRLYSLDAGLREEAMKSLGEIEGELGEINESITKLVNAVDRTTIVSPVRGLVKGLNVNTIGAVIEPGRTLLEIVPVEEELIVEALVVPTDIGALENGQNVKVKVSAYDFSRYGSIPGKIQAISASTFQTEKGDTYYKTKIRLDQNYAGKNPAMNMVLPGMTVQADIVTGQKTILEYLLKPLHQVTQNALSER